MQTAEVSHSVHLEIQSFVRACSKMPFFEPKKHKRQKIAFLKSKFTITILKQCNQVPED